MKKHAKKRRSQVIGVAVPANPGPALTASAGCLKAMDAQVLSPEEERLNRLVGDLRSQLAVSKPSRLLGDLYISRANVFDDLDASEKGREQALRSLTEARVQIQRLEGQIQVDQIWREETRDANLRLGAFVEKLQKRVFELQAKLRNERAEKNSAGLFHQEDSDLGKAALLKNLEKLVKNLRDETPRASRSSRSSR